MNFCGKNGCFQDKRFGFEKKFQKDRLLEKKAKALTPNLNPIPNPNTNLNQKGGKNEFLPKMGALNP